jgi:hypothetical protein
MFFPISNKAISQARDGLGRAGMVSNISAACAKASQSCALGVPFINKNQWGLFVGDSSPIELRNALRKRKWLMARQAQRLRHKSAKNLPELVLVL